MLPDSMNVGVIAENIKKLETMVQEAGSELPTPEAGDTGKIIKVGSEGYELATEYSYTPPAYSKTEDVPTGKLWIDGSMIYERVYEGTTGETGNTVITDRSDITTLCEIEAHLTSIYDVLENMDDLNMRPRYSAATGIAFTNSTTAAYQNVPYYAIVTFTKTAPVPSETKKKTSKKGEQKS